MKKISIATAILITLLLAAVSSFAQTQSREDILKQIEAKRAELDLLEKRFLSPSEEDKAKYAHFLRQRRLDSDDSAVILWKLVKKYPTPVLSRN